MKLKAIAISMVLAASGPALADDEPIQMTEDEGGEVTAVEEAGTETAETAEAPRAAAPAPSVDASPTTEVAAEAAPFVSDGDRIVVEGRGFSIRPPRGWEVHTGVPTLSLLLQIPHKEGLRYRRTIQVASFTGARYMDDITAKEFETLIVKKFSEASGNVEGYRLRNRMPIEMADGREGLLFYTEFAIDGVDLMQAHVLVSATERHYLLTYTDLREHFEDDDSRYLTEAWDAIISTELEGRTPGRFEAFETIGIAFGVLLLLVGFGFAARRWRAKRQLAEYTMGLDDGESDTKSQVARSMTGASLMSLPETTAPETGSLTSQPLKKVEKRDKRASQGLGDEYKVAAETSHPTSGLPSLVTSRPAKELKRSSPKAVPVGKGKGGKEADEVSGVSELTGLSRFDDEDQAV